MAKKKYEYIVVIPFNDESCAILALKRSEFRGIIIKRKCGWYTQNKKLNLREDKNG